MLKVQSQLGMLSLLPCMCVLRVCHQLTVSLLLVLRVRVQCELCKGEQLLKVVLPVPEGLHALCVGSRAPHAHLDLGSQRVGLCCHLPTALS